MFHHHKLLRCDILYIYTPHLLLIDSLIWFRGYMLASSPVTRARKPSLKRSKLFSWELSPPPWSTVKEMNIGGHYWTKMIQNGQIHSDWCTVKGLLPIFLDFSLSNVLRQDQNHSWITCYKCPYLVNLPKIPVQGLNPTNYHLEGVFQIGLLWEPPETLRFVKKPQSL